MIMVGIMFFVRNRYTVYPTNILLECFTLLTLIMKES